MNQQPSIYELAGGDAPFHRLIDAFYERVEHEPLLRPLYPADLAPSREHLFLFVTQYFGGPPRYNALRGHPRLRMRHAPFAIGQAERDAWVRHMLAAVEAAGFADRVLRSRRDLPDQPGGAWVDRAARVARLSIRVSNPERFLSLDDYFLAPSRAILGPMAFG